MCYFPFFPPLRAVLVRFLPVFSPTVPWEACGASRLTLEFAECDLAFSALSCLHIFCNLIQFLYVFSRAVQRGALQGSLLTSEIVDCSSVVFFLGHFNPIPSCVPSCCSVGGAAEPRF